MTPDQRYREMIETANPERLLWEIKQSRDHTKKLVKLYKMIMAGKQALADSAPKRVKDS